MTMLLHVLSLLFVSLALTDAFQVVGNVGVPCSRLFMAAQDDQDVETYLNANHPIFVQALLSKNDKVWKSIRADGAQSTIFAPTDQVFVELGEKVSRLCRLALILLFAARSLSVWYQRRTQFGDERNRETVEKIAAYHVINEPVTADELFASGGVITLGGEIPVERTTTGGMFGLGGKEDGGVTINGAKVTETTNIGDCIIHSVDKVVSPNVLWRYMDQLRIPGSS